MPYQHIVFKVVDDLAQIELNRPLSLNALSRQMLDELIDAVDHARGNVRALMISAAGRAFCAGADLTSNAPSDGPSPHSAVDAGAILQTHYNPLMERLAALPVPIVAAVQGGAVGAGCSLALAADFVLAARSAYFLLAFVNIGLVPDAGLTWLLPRLIGRARATSLMMLGERLNAEQAESWGLIHRCVDDAALVSTSLELARRLAQGPTNAYALIRSGLRSSLQTDLSTSLAVERDNQRTAGNTSDFGEGVAAFLTRRTPVFKGC